MKNEVEIDLSKLVSFFKKKPKKKSHKAPELDLSRLKFLKQPWLITLVLILIPLVVSFSLRMAPASLPVTDSWASSAVYNRIKASLGQEINQQYPNLPDAQKQELLTNMFTKMLQERRDDIQGSIEKTSQYFKERLKNANGSTYLLAIDPYTYFRRARNILEKGHPWDTLKNGVPWNTHMIAPLGRKMGFNLHPYIIAVNHRILSLFGFKDLMGTAFFVPIIISALSVIPAFFLGRRFAGITGGFVAAWIVAVAAPAISRTAGGFVDTDAYNILFPLLILWLFIEAMENNKLGLKVVLGSLAGVLVGLYSALWEWWFVFDLVLLVILSYFGFNILKGFLQKRSIKLESRVISNIYSSIAFVLASGLVVSLFNGIHEFMVGPFSRPIMVYYYKAVAVFKIWPNVMTTVAEQNAMNVQSVINTIGGPLMLFTALLGLYFVLFDLKRLSKRDAYHLLTGGIWIFIFVLFIQPKNALWFDIFIFLPFAFRYFTLLRVKEYVSIEFSVVSIFWFLITFFAAVRGVRFTLLLVPVFALGFGVAIGKFYVLLQRVFQNTLGLEQWVARVIIIAGVVLVLIPPTLSGYKTAIHEIPSMNDAWFNALTKIKQESQPDAIINSWWDFGHWFKAIADRAVTFDGASQNTPMAHWIGLSLLSSNESLTVGILRMLDCGSNTAFDVLNEELKDTPRSVELLYRIITEDKSQASRVLKSNGVSDGTAEEVLKYTHCQPPEDYYIVSDDMIGKSGVWAHFGSWDFKKAEIYRDTKRLDKEAALEMLESKYNFSQEKAIRYYYEIQSTPANNWIAPWPSYASREASCTQRGPKLVCTHRLSNNNILPFEVNLTTNEVFIVTDNGKVYPNKFVYPTEGGLKEKDYSGKLLGIAFCLIPPKGPGDSYHSVLTAPELALSTFNKLFFYNGLGTRCFKLFDHRTQLSGGDIYVYKVDWSCGKQNETLSSNASI